MLNVLHRTTLDPALLDQPAPEIERRPSLPPERPTEKKPVSRWPVSARVIVSALAVLAVVGAVGTIVGLSRGDDTTATELQERVDDLLAEQDLLRVARDETAQEVAELEASLVDLARSREVISNELAAASATVLELEASMVRLVRNSEVVSNELAAVSLELATTQAELADAESALVAQIQLTEGAVTERDALAALFPLSLDATLAGVDLAGIYDVDMTTIYCDGFADCSALLQFDELTIVETNQGWLRIEIDDYYDAGLFAVDGSLYAVAGSTTAAPDCNGVPRQATVSVTLYARGLTVADDGSHAIDDLGANLTIDAPATGSCERGLAFSGLELAPT